MVANENTINDCTSPDSVVGFGALTGGSACRVPASFTGGPSVGAQDGTSACGGTDSNVVNFGYLFVQ